MSSALPRTLTASQVHASFSKVPRKRSATFSAFPMSDE